MASSQISTDIKRLTGKSVVYGLGNLGVAAIAFFLIPLYTRYLTPPEYGILAVTGTLTTVLSLLYTLGLHGALTRLYFNAQNAQDRREVLGTIWLAMILTAGGMALVLDRAGAIVFPSLFEGVPFVPYIRLAIWTAFLNIFSLLPLTLFQIQERSGLYVLGTAASTLLTLGLVVGLVVYWRQGVFGALLGMLLAAASLAVPYVILGLRTVRVVLRWEILKAALAYSLPLVAHGIGGWMIELSDRAILERFVSLGDLGLYALGYQLAGIMNMIATSINTAWVPFVFRKVTQQGEAANLDLARLATYYTFLLCWAALGLALLVKYLLLLFTAPTFHSAYPVIPWIIGAYVWNGLYFIPVNFLFVKAKTWLLPVATITSGFVNVGLNLWLIPQYGIIAAAWATFLAYGIMLLLIWFAALRVYPLPYEYKRIGQIMLAAGGLFIVGNMVSLPSMLVEAALRSALWVAFPGILAALGFFMPAETEKAMVFAKQTLVRAQHAIGLGHR